ncbi:MAG: flagellar protein FlaG [Deltaproteobacteria bacterium]|nr:flagellar protein FlaG [Deltaproteobacteria bacterium]
MRIQPVEPTAVANAQRSSTPSRATEPSTEQPEPVREPAPVEDTPKAETKPPPPPPEFPLHELSIRHDADIHRLVVQVINSQTREVVRQIPSERFVRALKSLESAKGLFVDGEG